MSYIKKIAVFALAAVSVLLLAFSAYAEEFKDYTIWDASWSYENGHAIAKWDKPEDSTTYKVRLIRNNKLVVDWLKSSGRSYDFTSRITGKGTGNYVFEVYPVKGDTSMAIASEELEVTSSMLSAMKKNVKNEAAAREATDGWHFYPDGTWTYGKGNSTLAKNEWMQIEGAWYHFDKDGKMQTGWQNIGGLSYYFDKTNGYMLSSTTTPDGYRVNERGEWIDDAGNPVVSVVKTAASKVNITLTEGGETGSVKNATVTGCSTGTVIAWSFSTPYENWKAGQAVGLNVVIQVPENVTFDKNTKFTCSNATVESWNGSNPYTVNITYVPRAKLEAPQNIYMDSDGYVRWYKVKNAAAYRVIMTEAGSSKSYIIKENSFNPYEYYAADGGDIKLKISALGSYKGTSKTFLESDRVEISLGDLDNTEFESVGGQWGGSMEHMTYRDESGEKVYDWQEIGGKWYFFNKSGYAVGPGWYQDTEDQNWYYFATDHSMVTGSITDGGVTYFMNDGSNGAYPLGAWVQQ